MINYSKYCNYKSINKNDQAVLFKERELCKLNGNTQRITEINNTIVCSYIPYVIKQIGKYKSDASISNDDLLHEGILGLYHALNKYNYKRNYTFSTYALPFIKWYIQLAFQNHYVLDITPHFLHKHKRNKKKDEKYNSPVSYVSLQKELKGYDGNKQLCVGDVIIDEHVKNPSEVFEEKDRHKYIETIINTLESDEQMIIRNRFGLNGDKMTLKEIGSILNLSRVRICMKEKSILKKLSYRVKLNA